jgi:dienelactone hydrolase
MRYLVLIMLMLPAFAHAQAVRVPGPEGIMLNADLFAAQGKARGAAIVALHGCSGPAPARDEGWARQLAASGHVVLLPDSFGSRGLGSQCAARTRLVTPTGVRRHDALAALRWLAERPGTPPGGLVLMGWSDGANTVLTAGRATADLSPGLIRGLIAFYPVCRGIAETKDWTPAAPLMILMGEPEENSPSVAACHAVADKFPGKVTLVTYAGAHHEFDVPEAPSRAKPAKAKHGLITPISGMTTANVNVAARDDAGRRVAAFIAGLP